MDLTTLGSRVETVEQLTSHYREPSQLARTKELDHLNEGMAAFVDHSPFLVLSTANGAGSVDASPRGGPAGFVRRLDDRHVAIPDLNGNNRLDSYRNIIDHPYVGLLLMAPGHDDTLRINGPAALTTDPDLLAGFTKELRAPKMAIVVEVAEAFGHCAKAFRRGHLWHPDEWDRFAGAPDLAAMYACHWNVDEQAARDDLEQAYRDEIATD